MRIRSPSAVAVLIPWFVPVNQEWWEIAELLRERLKSDDTFCVVAIEDDRIQGWIAAYCVDNDFWDQHYVYIWQTRVRSVFDRPGMRYNKMVLEGLIMWARAKGYKEVRTNSPKYNNYFCRRYGFTKDRRGIVRKIA